MINRESRRPRTTLIPDPSAPAAAEARSHTLSISADTVIAGIAFHLVENKVAPAVDDQAASQALARLQRERFTATVARAAWQSMTDPERLEWLLAISDTAYALRNDNVAVLKRRSR